MRGWTVLAAAALAACGPSRSERAAALEAFVTIEQVFQHPRCRNCHISGDAPLQFDEGRAHAQGVVRGPAGHGAPGLPCASCHGSENPPAAYGPHAPPGAPHWGLPPPQQKMAWMGLSRAELCEMIQDVNANGGRDLEALLTHVSTDPLVLWGWAPGGNRAPVPVPHEEFVAKFELWASAGAPCPAPDAQASSR
jgi:hypothetical protein